MRTIIYATIAVLLIGPAGAQDFFGIPGLPGAQNFFGIPGLPTTATTSTAVLTKAERGKAMIGLCYSTCAHRYQKATIHMLRGAADVFEEGQRCFMAQTFIRSIDACAASCADVERIFGITESEAKNRFNSLAADVRENFETSALWTAHNDFAARGSAEFETACEEFLGYCTGSNKWSAQCRY